MMEKVKKRHHLVFQRYLANWTTNGRLFCLRNRKSIVQSGTRAIAQQKYFYRIPELSREDVMSIALLTESMSEQAKGVTKSLMDLFMIPFDYRNYVDLTAQNNEKTEMIFTRQTTNVVENYHCKWEGEGANFISRIEKNDLSFWDDVKECQKFCYFLAIQYFRTDGIKSVMVKDFEKRAGLNLKKGVLHLPNLERVWWFMSLVFPVSTGEHLSNNHHLRVLVNDTETPFITSDQPAINLKMQVDDLLPDELEMYYPISQNIAVIVAPSERHFFTSEPIRREMVSSLNDSIVNLSYNEVYSNNKSVLEAYLT